MARKARTKSTATVWHRWAKDYPRSEDGSTPGILFIPLGARPAPGADKTAWDEAKKPALSKDIKRFDSTYTYGHRAGAKRALLAPFALDLIVAMAEAGHLIGLVLVSVRAAFLDFDAESSWDGYERYLKMHLNQPAIFSAPSRHSGHLHIPICLDVSDYAEIEAAGGTKELGYSGKHVGTFKCWNQYAVLYHPTKWRAALKAAQASPVLPSRYLGLRTHKGGTGHSALVCEAQVRRAINAIRTAEPKTAYNIMRRETFNLARYGMEPADIVDARTAYVTRHPLEEKKQGEEFDKCFKGAQLKVTQSAGVGGAAAVTFDDQEEILRAMRYELRFNTRALRVEIRLFDSTRDGDNDTMENFHFDTLLNEEAGVWVPLEDTHVTWLRSLIEGQYVTDPGDKPWKMAKDTFYDGVNLIANKSKVDPFLDWVREFEWDGKPRIDTWLSRVYTFDTDILPEYTAKQYTALVHWASRSILMSAIERAIKPGFKVDTSIVLRSVIGNYKSTLFEMLFPENYQADWFLDDVDLAKITSKEVLEKLAGGVIIEIAELAGAKHRDIQNVNAFMTSRRDRARVAYARLAHTVMRRFVFVGTCNHNAKFKAPDGNRRFIPLDIKAGQLETKFAVVKAVTDERDQLWAEALDRVANGETSVVPEGLKRILLAAGATLIEEEPLGDLLDDREWPAPSYTLHGIAEIVGMLSRKVIVEGNETEITDVAGKLSKAEERRLGTALHERGWSKAKRRWESAKHGATSRWVPPGMDVKHAEDMTRAQFADPALKTISDQMSDADKEMVKGAKAMRTIKASRSYNKEYHEQASVLNPTS